MYEGKKIEEIILLVIYITEVIKYWVFLKGICDVKLPYFKTILVGTILFSTLIFGGVINKEVPLIWVSGVALIFLFFMKNKNKEDKAILLKTFLILACMGEIIGIFLSGGRKIIRYETLIEHYLESNMVSIVVLIFIFVIERYSCIRPMKQLQIFCVKHIYFTILMVGIVLLLTISGIQFAAQYIKDDFVEKLLLATSILAFIGVGFLGIVFTYIDNENRKMKKYLEMDQLLLKTQEKFYVAMLAKEDDTRRFRHDIRNHMICLGELAAREETERMQKYIGELSGQLQKIEKKYYSVGNHVIDSIINYYTGLMDQDIMIEVTGICNCRLEISEVDLCTVISNLVQNAMEELNRKKEEKQYFKMILGRGETYFKIEIINSLSESKEGSYHSMLTSKPDKKNHGIGLRNVKETVERNKGIFETFVTENEFKASVILLIQKVYDR